MQQIVIIEINLVAAPAEIITEMAGQAAFGGNVWRERWKW